MAHPLHKHIFFVNYWLCGHTRTRKLSGYCWHGDKSRTRSADASTTIFSCSMPGLCSPHAYTMNELVVRTLRCAEWGCRLCSCSNGNPHLILVWGPRFKPRPQNCEASVHSTTFCLVFFFTMIFKRAVISFTFANFNTWYGWVKWNYIPVARASASLTLVIVICCGSCHSRPPLPWTATCESCVFWSPSCLAAVVWQ